MGMRLRPLNLIPVEHISRQISEQPQDRKWEMKAKCYVKEKLPPLRISSTCWSQMLFCKWHDRILLFQRSQSFHLINKTGKKTLRKEPDKLDKTDSSSRHCKGGNSNWKVHLESIKRDKFPEWCSFRVRYCTWSGYRTHQKEQMNQHRSWSRYQREEKNALFECMPSLHANRILSLHFQYQEFSSNSLDRSLHKCLSWYIEFALFKSVCFLTAQFYV